MTAAEARGPRWHQRGCPHSRWPNPQPTLFEGIAWSTGGVMDATRQRMKILELRWAELDVLWDLDRPEDLDRLQTDPRLRDLAPGR